MSVPAGPDHKSKPDPKPRKPARRPAPDCASPLCDRLADGPYAMTITQPDRGPWVTCSPDCAVTWLRLSLVRTEAAGDRLESESEAEA